LGKQNVCGISVVPGDYEELKRYNLAEICEPSPAQAKTEPELQVRAGDDEEGPTAVI